MSNETEPRIDAANIAITAKDKAMATAYANEIKQKFFGKSYPVVLVKKLKNESEWLITLGINEDMAHKSRDKWLQEAEEDW